MLSPRNPHPFDSMSHFAAVCKSRNGEPITPSVMKSIRRAGMPSSSVPRVPDVNERNGSSYSVTRSSNAFSPQRSISGDEPVATLVPLKPDSSGGNIEPANPGGVNTTGMSLPTGADTIRCELRKFANNRSTTASTSAASNLAPELMPSQTLSMSVPLMTSAPTDTPCWVPSDSMLAPAELAIRCSWRTVVTCTSHNASGNSANTRATISPPTCNISSAAISDTRASDDSTDGYDDCPGNLNRASAPYSAASEARSTSSSTREASVVDAKPTRPSRLIKRKAWPEDLRVETFLA